MSETTNEARRRQAFLRVMGLVFAGYGICPGCMEKQEVYSRRHMRLGQGKERCLECWRAER